MADIAEGLEPAKPEGAKTEHRPTGATYKMLLKAVLEAIDHDSFDVAVVVPNRAVMMQCIQMLTPITAPLRDFVQIKYSNQLALFNNGSAITFRVPEQQIMIKINLLMVDESWYHNPCAQDDRSLKWIKGLRQIENQFGSNRG